MQPSAHAISQPGVHEAHHEEQGFWSKYVFSTDHKIIGIQYGVTALFFLFFGFCLMLCMRWQIAHPGDPIPLIGKLLEKALAEPGGQNLAAQGVMSPDLYNSFGAMHGTIMVFLAIVPLALCNSWTRWRIRAFSFGPAWPLMVRCPWLVAAAVRCYGSTFSGFLAIRRSMC